MRILKGGIAFFDSGIGGLTVLDECRKRLPREIFYYYGDNKRAPYGNLPPKTIKKYVYKAFKRFQRWKVKAVVLACNTATAVCVEDLRKDFNFPIVGAEPAIMSAAKLGGRVYVLSTRATYNSDRFSKLCQKVKGCYSETEIVSLPCDGLAGEIEKHLFDENFDFTSLLPQGNPSAVVLGCTHYIYLKKKIQGFYRCPCYDGNEGIARRLQAALLGKKSRKKEFLTKNRDGRPLERFLSRKKDLSTTFNPLKTKGIKTNKCSWLWSQKRSKNKGIIFFVGNGKKHNKRVYERMFGSKMMKSG